MIHVNENLISVGIFYLLPRHCGNASVLIIMTRVFRNIQQKTIQHLFVNVLDLLFLFYQTSELDYLSADKSGHRWK